MTYPSSPAYFPAALTVAGSDSGGGAGIEADLRAFHAFSVYGSAAIAAVTAQNPCEVRRIDPLPPEALTAQIQSVLGVVNIRAAKTGMLFSAPLIRAAAEALRGKTFPLVVDPVMVATSGARLLREDAVEAVKNDLLSLADWITPNLPEAELLLGREIRSFDEALRAASDLAGKYSCGVIVKGGHAQNDSMARDAVFADGRLYALISPRIETPPHATHGTGCSFSAALTAALAKGNSACEALLQAKSFLLNSLRGAGMISAPGAKNAVAGMPPPVPGPFSEPSVGLEPLS